MSYAARSQLVTEIAHDLIVQLAPQELPLFQETSQAYLKNPTRMLKSLQGKDEPLGFGLLEIGSAVAMSPLVLAIVDEVIKALAEEVPESGVVKKFVKKLLPHAKEQQDPLPRLTTEQMQQVRQQALRSARQFHLSESQATLLADALVGRLALAQR